ncbi:MAG: dihydropteroate synthase [Puniceicoccales bacterium]|jgi:2-amino-4-hydroxy-6-hydroxymethyldihydropteridine diphosphokinase/dihydropteroate synthase|nr:dihydropteroate synthase [Puniceicoccales bacterium]
MIYLALGSNLGNRFENFRRALTELSRFFEIKIKSLIIETKAILKKNAPAEWNVPYLNMIVAGNSHCLPMELLEKIKIVEMQLGRDLNAEIWAPRLIDIDILFYENESMDTPTLSIPHKQIKNRDFIQFLLEEIGYQIPKNMKTDSSQYVALNHFVLNPKLVAILNVTPDSFSDGGKFLLPNLAEAHINDLYANGAHIIELGAQSTKPGYTEISAAEEISRLSEILERCHHIDCLGLDSSQDDVVKCLIKNYHFPWINDQNSKLSDETLKLIADTGAKFITMLHGMDLSWFTNRINYLENLGLKRENIIIDPGIGFGKTRLQNIEITKNLARIKEFGCDILYGHSRKSFMTLFSNAPANDRDIETIAVSNFVDGIVDYLRIHNLKDHMKFFVAKHYLTIATS